MNSTDRADYLETRLKAFLSRRSPPRGLTGEALVDEMGALAAAVHRFAPSQGFEAWWEAVERHIAESSKFRSWPTQGELADAARNVRTVAPGSGDDGAMAKVRAEHEAVDRMEAYYRRTGGQLFGFGRTDRTKALIARGVMADLREARWRGFDLDMEDLRRARDMRTGRAEWEHHVGVMGRIKGLEPSEAEAYCIEVCSGAQLPQHLSHLDKGQGPAPFSGPREGFRRMGPATAGPRTPASHLIEEEATPPSRTAEEAASRPYTEAELARMAMLRPKPDLQQQAQS